MLRIYSGHVQRDRATEADGRLYCLDAYEGDFPPPAMMSVNTFMICWVAGINGFGDGSADQSQRSNAALDAGSEVKLLRGAFDWPERGRWTLHVWLH